MKTYSQLIESLNTPVIDPASTVLYCDMDEVLVNFLGGAKKALGIDFNDPYFIGKKSQKWGDLLTRHPKFWEQLDWEPGAKTLWNHIKKYNPHILSAYPEYEGDDPQIAIEGKTLWCKRNLDIPTSRVHCGARTSKKEFATRNGEPNVLIDDYIANIKEWERAGGIGVHHRETPLTISKLTKMGFV